MVLVRILVLEGANMRLEEAA